jgi:hypothetical protein
VIPGRAAPAGHRAHRRSRARRPRRSACAVLRCPRRRLADLRASGRVAVEQRARRRDHPGWRSRTQPHRSGRRPTGSGSVKSRRGDVRGSGPSMVVIAWPSALPASHAAEHRLAVLEHSAGAAVALVAAPACAGRAQAVAQDLDSVQWSGAATSSWSPLTSGAEHAWPHSPRRERGQAYGLQAHETRPALADRLVPEPKKGQARLRGARRASSRPGPACGCACGGCSAGGRARSSPSSCGRPASAARCGRSTARGAGPRAAVLAGLAVAAEEVAAAEGAPASPARQQRASARSSGRAGSALRTVRTRTPAGALLLILPGAQAEPGWHPAPSRPRWPSIAGRGGAPGRCTQRPGSFSTSEGADCRTLGMWTRVAWRGLSCSITIPGRRPLARPSVGSKAVTSGAAPRQSRAPTTDRPAPLLALAPHAGRRGPSKLRVREDGSTVVPACSSSGT